MGVEICIHRFLFLAHIGKLCMRINRRNLGNVHHLVPSLRVRAAALRLRGARLGLHCSHML